MKNKLSNQEKHLAKLQIERDNRRQAIEETIFACKNLPLEQRPQSFRQFAAMTPYTKAKLDLLLNTDANLKQRVYECLNPTKSVRACYEKGVTGVYNTTRVSVTETIEKAEDEHFVFNTREDFYKACGLAPSTVRHFLYCNPKLRERFESILSTQKVVLEILPTVANGYVRGNVGNTVQLSDTLRLVDLGGEIVAPCLNPACQSRECVTQLQGWKDRSRYRRAHWALKGHLCRDCAGVMVGKYNNESVG